MMDINRPIVSIVIPSYNHASYIMETITSCIDQDYDGLIDIIVIDDFSTDGTKDIISKLGHLENSRRKITVLCKSENRGLNDSLSIGIDTASGKYIQILASDDIICIDKISKQVDFLEGSQYDCVYSRLFTIENGKKKEIFLSEFKKEYDRNCGLKFVSTKDWGGPLAQSALFKASLLSNLKKIRLEYKSDDWAMLIFIFQHYNPGYYDLPLITYRIHSNNSYKKYWNTFPMRVDVVSRLIQEKYRSKALSNILMSQAAYLAYDARKSDSIKFMMSSLALGISLSFLRIILILLLPKSFHRAFRSLINKYL